MLRGETLNILVTDSTNQALNCALKIFAKIASCSSCKSFRTFQFFIRSISVTLSVKYTLGIRISIWLLSYGYLSLFSHTCCIFVTVYDFRNRIECTCRKSKTGVYEKVSERIRIVLKKAHFSVTAYVFLNWEK